MRATHRSRCHRSALTTLSATALALLLAAAPGLTTGAGAQTAGTSGAGIVPSVINGDGGNVTCAEVPSDATLTSSERLNVQGSGLTGTLPTGLSATLSANKRELSWTSTFPITAVIVKGGNTANVYVYAPALLSDTGLAAPLRSKGQATEISNVTFCWDADGDDDGNGVDLQALCLTAATEADLGPVVSFAGPILIEDGAIVMSTVPDGVDVSFDMMSDLLSFTAPFPVLVAVTATSLPVVHPIDPPSTTGSVPLSGNPGDGQLMLCGLDTEVAVTVSCAQTGADTELGPVPIVAGKVDPALVPPPVKRLEVLEDAVAFESELPVLGVLVAASPVRLLAFPEPVLAAVVPVPLTEAELIELTFCVRTVTTSTGGQSSTTTTTEEATPAQAQDPTEIATGGGPSGRTTLALLSFLVLSLAGSSTMLLWSRGG